MADPNPGQTSHDRDIHGYVTGFNTAVRGIKRILWAGIFVALVIILTLTAHRSAT